MAHDGASAVPAAADSEGDELVVSGGTIGSWDVVSAAMMLA